MGKGKKVVFDYIPAGTPENKTGDPTDEYLSATDLGIDFAATPVPNALADVNEQ